MNEDIEDIENTEDTEDIGGIDGIEGIEDIEDVKTVVTDDERFVVEFGLKTQPWQDDVFDKILFPQANQFQDVFNDYMMKWFNNLLSSDEQFRVSWDYLKEYYHDFDRCRYLIKKRGEYEAKKSRGEPAESLKKSELKTSEKKYLEEYEPKYPELEKAVNFCADTYYPDAEKHAKEKAKKESKKTGKECKPREKFYQVAWEAFGYCQKTAGKSVINQPFVGKAHGDTVCKPITFGGKSNGFMAFAGNIRNFEVDKNGSPFETTIPVSVARGCACRSLSYWNRRLCMWQTMLDKLNDPEKADCDSITFALKDSWQLLDLDKLDFQPPVIRLSVKECLKQNADKKKKFPRKFGKKKPDERFLGKGSRFLFIPIQFGKDKYRSDVLINCKLAQSKPQLTKIVNGKVTHPKRNGELCISEATIVRRPFGRKYRYFVQLTFAGHPPADKKKLVHGDGTVGIDIGPSGYAWWSVKAADGAKYEPKELERCIKRVKELQQKMERSDRVNNPENYDKDGEHIEGTVNKHTKNYMRMQMELASLRRRCAEYLKNQNGEEIVKLLEKGDSFIIEQARPSEWTKRSPDPDETRSGKKKRFGDGVAKFAPGSFLKRTEEKAKRSGIKVRVISTYVAATQFDHTDHSFTPHKVIERKITLKDGSVVERDIHAAFNVAHIRKDANVNVGVRVDSKEVKKNPTAYYDFSSGGFSQEEYDGLLKKSEELIKKSEDKLTKNT